MALKNSGIPSYTWATKPAIANWPSYRPIILTDVGVGGSMWHHDGVNWRPVSGFVEIARGLGTVAAPIDTKSGVVADRFAVPGGNPTIPAGLLIPGSSRVEIGARILKVGANGTFIGYASIGTLDDSDLSQNAGQVASSPAGDLSMRLFTQAWFTGTGAFTTDVSVPPHADSSVSFADRSSANLNTDALMYVNFGYYNANAADSFTLLGYNVGVWV